MAAWRLAMVAGITGNGFLLVADIVFGYFMCMIWFPVFPYEQRSMDE
jgi:hypothetical protein